MRFKGYHDAGTVTIAWAGDLVLGEHGVVQDTLISCGVDGKILVFHTGKPHFAPVLLEDILAQANPAWSKANQVFGCVNVYMQRWLICFYRPK